MAIKKGRNPKWEPTDKDRQEISALIGLGLTAEQVATLKGVCRDTLYKYCKKEIQLGRPMSIARVTKTAYEMAISGKHPAMTMFWLKTQAGWRETDRPEPQTIDITPEKTLNPIAAAIEGTVKTDWVGYAEPGYGIEPVDDDE